MVSKRNKSHLHPRMSISAARVDDLVTRICPLPLLPSHLSSSLYSGEYPFESLEECQVSCVAVDESDGAASASPSGESPLIKYAWPALEGTPVESAVHTIKTERPGLHVLPVVAGSPVTADYRTDRVRVYFNPSTMTVEGVPCIG